MDAEEKSMVKASRFKKLLAKCSDAFRSVDAADVAASAATIVKRERNRRDNQPLAGLS